MTPDHDDGEYFAATAEPIENKALRLNDTNKANAEQALRFARTDEERRAIKLAALHATVRDRDARARADGSPDDTDTTTDSEVPCSE